MVSWEIIPVLSIKLNFYKKLNCTMQNHFLFQKFMKKIETLKTDHNRLVNKGVLNHKNNSEWAVPTFIIPKRNVTVHFISDFRQLNKRIKRKPFPIPKIQDLCF